MEKTVLTQHQQTALSFLSQEKLLTEAFYLSGGTALAEYYLHHRYSEDLDFFSFEEFDPISIQVIFKKIQKHVGFSTIDYQQSFNRNLFFLHFQSDEIKTEFTYYPFEQLELPTLSHGLKVDSLLDIAVNKVFTIYQNPRSRDFIDLYLILTMSQLSLADLKKKARVKFDTHIDPLQLAQQFLQVTDLKEYPRMIVPLNYSLVESFWLNESRRLKKEILR